MTYYTAEMRENLVLFMYKRKQTTFGCQKVCADRSRFYCIMGNLIRAGMVRTKNHPDNNQKRTYHLTFPGDLYATQLSYIREVENNAKSKNTLGAK